MTEQVAAEQVALTIDGEEVTVDAGSTILDACRVRSGPGSEIPTLCYGETITPKKSVWVNPIPGHPRCH